MSAPPDTDPHERPTLERLIPELLKKVIETGAKNLSTDSLRQLLGELKLPKEAIHYTISHLDETRQGVYRTISKEVRELFDRTSLSEELAKALSLLTLEVKMEVRFKPSANESGARVSPVETSVRVKRAEPRPNDPRSGPGTSADHPTPSEAGRAQESSRPSEPPVDVEQRKE
jgi:hypothetical protein